MNKKYDPRWNVDHIQCYAVRGIKNRICVEILIKLSVGINVVYGGKTPLKTVVFGEDPDIVILLLNNGADINAITDGGRECIIVQASMYS